MSIPGWPLAVFLVVASPAGHAQPLRSLVVGGEQQVVVPPRGAAPLPRPPAVPLSPMELAAPALPAMPSAPVAGLGLSAALPVLLPVAAAILLGAGSPGSGGGASAPASTR